MTVAFNSKLLITQHNNRFYVNGKIILTKLKYILNSQTWDYIHPSLK